MITAKQYEALGRMTVAYAGLEWNLSALIWMFVGAQLLAQTITADLQFQGRIAFATRLVEILERYGLAVEGKRIRRALERAGKAAGKRNALVHALTWVPEGDDSKVLTAHMQRRRAAGEWVPVPASTEDIEIVAAGLDEAAREINACLTDHSRRHPGLHSPMATGSVVGVSIESAIGFLAKDFKHK